MAMTTETPDVDALPPDQSEIAVAERLSQALAKQIARGDTPAMFLAGEESGAREPLPATAAKLLVKILSEIAKGNTVAILPLKPELTTQETAELLSLSRPHLIKLLDRGELPFHRVGTHRRIRLSDVLAYKRKALEERKAILREMVALNQEMGLYD
ncbi:MAG: helix-turn-helix domain-containing protein [Blastocatellia bacterium]